MTVVGVRAQEDSLFVFTAPLPRWMVSAPRKVYIPEPLPGDTGVRAHFSLARIAFFWTDGSTLPAPSSALGRHTIPPHWHVVVPYWALAVVTVVMPACWIIRRRPVPKGRCPACGYDMRATPDRCPECGAVPAEPAAA
jgi:hypothetical protein